MQKTHLRESPIVRNRIGERLSQTSPFFVRAIIIALILGVILGATGSYIPAIVIGMCAMITLLLFRQDELTVVCILVLHLYVDWYLGRLVIAQLLVGMLLLIFFIARSPQHPWKAPRAMWLWGIFLIFAIYPSIQGTTDLYTAAFYYPNILLGALLMFWLGTTISKDIVFLKRFFRILTAAGTILAIITIIQARTGTLLFGTSRFDNYLASVSNYNLMPGSNDYRLGSFLVNPDWNGAFFAFMLCIPISLFAESTFAFEKIFYLIEALIILPALLATYSIGAWIGAVIAIIAIIMLAGHIAHRIQILLFLLISAIVMFIGFSSQITILFQHGSNPADLSLRIGAWQTAIKVIQAFPLTGTGLGTQSYMRYAEPYRVAAQYIPLAHPHNSYLELGAMAGLPILLLFIALLGFSLWLALHNWALLDSRQRVLLGGGIAAIIALSINSLSVNAWTLPPLAAFGWLILGVISSPLLTQSLRSKQERNDNEFTNTTS